MSAPKEKVEISRLGKAESKLIRLEHAIESIKTLVSQSTAAAAAVSALDRSATLQEIEAAAWLAISVAHVDRLQALSREHEETVFELQAAIQEHNQKLTEEP